MEPAGAESSAFEPQPSFSETEEPLALSAETGETEVLLEGLPPPIEAVSRPEPPSEPVSAEPAAAVPGQLMFLFSGPCWVEVRDASGKARIFGEMREGARRSVDANLGPFSITLGNADVVELTVNGQAYDLTPHVRGNVARFSLDPSKI